MSPGKVPLPASILGSRHMETIWEAQARNGLPQSESTEHGMPGWALLAVDAASGANVWGPESSATSFDWLEPHPTRETRTKERLMSLVMPRSLCKPGASQICVQVPMCAQGLPRAFLR